MNHSASINHFKLTTGANQALLTVSDANKKLASTAATLHKQQTASAGIDLSKTADTKTSSSAATLEGAADDSKQSKQVWWRQLLISESTRSGAKTASVARLR